jgi:hypothetical protein
MVVLQAKKKDNLSREMKQRLRQEYYGLGGSEKQVSLKLTLLLQLGGDGTCETLATMPCQLVSTIHTITH